MCLCFQWINFRLVCMYVQRKRSARPCCHHQSGGGGREWFTNNKVSSHQYLTHTNETPCSYQFDRPCTKQNVTYAHQPKHIWTVESDPIYEDISEVKKKAVQSDSKDSRESKRKVPTSQSSSSIASTVQYGVITAKEVAKFVPCTDVNIRRW